MFRVQLWGGLGCLEVERKPFLDAFHSGAFCKVHEDRKGECERRGKDGIAAKEIDLDLHLVAEPAKNIDVIPSFFVIAARRIVVDTDDVREIAVEVGVNFGLKDMFENRQLRNL